MGGVFVAETVSGDDAGDLLPMGGKTPPPPRGGAEERRFFRMRAATPHFELSGGKEEPGRGAVWISFHDVLVLICFGLGRSLKIR